jgi:hypothetical protein
LKIKKKLSVKKGEIFKVISSITLKHPTYHATNTGFITTKDHKPGIKLVSSGGYLVVGKASAIQDIEFCPHCCVVYGKTFTKCEHCENHVSFN